MSFFRVAFRTLKDHENHFIVLENFPRFIVFDMKFLKAKGINEKHSPVFAFTKKLKNCFSRKSVGKIKCKKSLTKSSTMIGEIKKSGFSNKSRNEIALLFWSINSFICHFYENGTQQSANSNSFLFWWKSIFISDHSITNDVYCKLALWAESQRTLQPDSSSPITPFLLTKQQPEQFSNQSKNIYLVGKYFCDFLCLWLIFFCSLRRTGSIVHHLLLILILLFC